MRRGLVKSLSAWLVHQLSKWYIYYETYFFLKGFEQVNVFFHHFQTNTNTVSHLFLWDGNGGFTERQSLGFT